MRWIFVRNAVNLVVNFCKKCGEKWWIIFFHRIHRNHRISYENSPHSPHFLRKFTQKPRPGWLSSCSLLDIWLVITGKCRNCRKVDNDARTRQDYSHYVYMLRQLRLSEEKMADGSRIALLLQVCSLLLISVQPTLRCQTESVCVQNVSDGKYLCSDLRMFSRFSCVQVVFRAFFYISRLCIYASRVEVSPPFNAKLCKICG